MVMFAPIAEAKRAGKASRRAEDTLKPPLAAGMHLRYLIVSNTQKRS